MRRFTFRLIALPLSFIIAACFSISASEHEFPESIPALQSTTPLTIDVVFVEAPFIGPNDDKALSLQSESARLLRDLLKEEAVLPDVQVGGPGPGLHLRTQIVYTDETSALTFISAFISGLSIMIIPGGGGSYYEDYRFTVIRANREVADFTYRSPKRRLYWGLLWFLGEHKIPLDLLLEPHRLQRFEGRISARPVIRRLLLDMQAAGLLQTAAGATR